MMHLDLATTEVLFDRLADVVFFVKDQAGRYVVVNETLRLRCGVGQKADLLGRTTDEVFPADFGTRYAQQDRLVLTTGAIIEDTLELHLYPNRVAGWCLTYKTPLHDGETIIGLVGISRDLHAPNRDDPQYQRIASVIQHIHDHYGGTLTMESLAMMAGCSISQFERQIKRTFGITPKQLIIKTRIEVATQLLAGDQTIADIAAQCGYSDQSAFSRQFRASVGMTPSQFRASMKP